MSQTTLDEIAFLFVEQYENLRGFYSENYSKSDVNLIRQAAGQGEAALYAVATTIFRNQMEEVLTGAAYSAMDYIAYMDETWTPRDAADIPRTLEREKIHLDALKGLLRMAQQNGNPAGECIQRIYQEAVEHLRRLESRGQDL